jgi:hypothetical protein
MRIQMMIAVLLVVLCISSVSAQDDTTNSITFNGVSFSVNDTLAHNFNIVQIPADDPNREMMGAPAPAHTQITLYNQDDEAPDFLDAVGAIYLYPIADFAQGYVGYQNVLETLQGLIDQQTDLTPYMEGAYDDEYRLPYIPVGGGAVQMLRARAEYFETDELVGLRYLVAYVQDMYPFSSHSFRYVFEGISKDRRYLFSATFNISTTVFPEQPSLDNFDHETFGSQIPEYVRESSAQLNAASPEDFTPSLTLLDAVGLSLTFED